MQTIQRHSPCSNEQRNEAQHPPYLAVCCRARKEVGQGPAAENRTHVRDEAPSELKAGNLVCEQLFEVWLVSGDVSPRLVSA